MKGFFLVPVILIATYSYAQNNRDVLNDNPLKTYIDSVVQKAAINYLKDTNTNGLSIGICYKGKNYSYNYGEVIRGSDRHPTANNFYNLGSVAKTFVALMLAQAVVEGKAKLTDDIRMYLPEQYPELEFKGQPIRLLDLANHTSALPKEFHHFSSSAMDSIGRLSTFAQVQYFNGYNADSLLADLHHLKPDTIPGTRYQYNGNAMMLLILLTERIYHQPFQKIVTNYLQHHLGMYHTKPVLSSSEMKQMAQGYNDDNRPEQYSNYTGFTGGPSMNSTINDMLKYLQANLSEKDKAIQLTHKPTFRRKDGSEMGLGWMMGRDKSGDRYIFHDGHTGIGFNTHCIFYPDQQLGFIIIVNDVTDQDRVTDIERSIKAAIVKH